MTDPLRTSKPLSDPDETRPLSDDQEPTVTLNGPAGAAPPAPPQGPPPQGPPPWSFPGGSGSTPNDLPFAAKFGLVRPIAGRYFAGVCAAIGRATNTDPILWRILLGVLTIFGGIGLVAYLVAWLLTPSEGDTASPLEALLGRGSSGTSPVLVIIVGTFATLLLLFALSDGFRPALLGLGIIVGAALLLSRRDSTHQRPGSSTVPPPIAPLAPHGPYAYAGPSPAYPPPPPYATPNAAGPITATRATPAAGYQYPPAASVPPPIWPAPPTTGPGPRPRPPRPRSPLGRITFCVLCLLLGVLAVFDLTGVDFHASVYAAVALAVIGVGLLVGTWIGRARWLIPIGLVLCIVLAGITAGERWDPPDSTGDQSWTPTSVLQVESRYENQFGNSTLDLRNVDFTNSTTDIEIRSKFGNFEVLLPASVDVEVATDLEFGNATVFDDSWNGRGDTNRASDLGSDGSGGGNLSITAKVRFGNLEVVR